MKSNSRHEIVGRVGSIWHILPHDGTNVVQIGRTVCGLTINADEYVSSLDGAEEAVDYDRMELHNYSRELCEVCSKTPARWDGLVRWNS